MNKTYQLLQLLQLYQLLQLLQLYQLLQLLNINKSNSVYKYFMITSILLHYYVLL